MGMDRLAMLAGEDAVAEAIYARHGAASSVERRVGTGAKGMRLVALAALMGASLWFAPGSTLWTEFLLIQLSVYAALGVDRLNDLARRRSS